MFSVFTSPELFGSLRKIFPDLSVHKVFLEDQYSKLEQLTFSDSFSTLISETLCLSPSYKPERSLAKDLKSKVLSQRGASTIEIKKVVFVFRETTRDNIKIKKDFGTKNQQKDQEETQNIVKNKNHEHKKQQQQQKEKQKQKEKKNIITLLDSSSSSDTENEYEKEGIKEQKSNQKRKKEVSSHYDFFEENTLVIKSLKIKLWKDNSELFSLDFVNCKLMMIEENITQLECQKLEFDIKYDTLELFFPSEFQLLKQHKLIFRSVSIQRSPVSLFFKIGSLTTSYHDLCYVLFWRKAILHFSLKISPKFDYHFQIENFVYNLGVSCLFFSDFNFKVNANSPFFSLSSNEFKYELLLNEGFKLHTSLLSYRNQSKTRLKLIQGDQFSINLMKDLNKTNINKEKEKEKGNEDKNENENENENENGNENDNKFEEKESVKNNKEDYIHNGKNINKKQLENNIKVNEKRKTNDKTISKNIMENEKLMLKLRIHNLTCAGRILNIVYLWYTFLDLYQRYQSFWNELTNESLFPKFLTIGYNIKIKNIKSVLLWLMKHHTEIQANAINLNKITIFKSTDFNSNILINFKEIDSDFCFGRGIQFLKSNKGLKISKTSIQMKNNKNLFSLTFEIFDYCLRIIEIVKDELMKMPTNQVDKNENSFQNYENQELLFKKNINNRNDNGEQENNLANLNKTEVKQQKEEKIEFEDQNESGTKIENGENRNGRTKENNNLIKIDVEKENDEMNTKKKRKKNRLSAGENESETTKNKPKSKSLDANKSSERLNLGHREKSSKSKSIEIPKQNLGKNQPTLINNLLLETLKIQEKIARCKYQLTEFEYPLLDLVKNLQNKAKLSSKSRTGRTGTSKLMSPKAITDMGAYLAGFGNKKGRVNKGWKKRWFILNKDRLRYFKQQQPLDEILHFELPLGSICLTNNIKVFRPEKKLVNKRKNCFAIQTTKRTFYIQPLNNSADDWISKIQDNIRGIRVNSYFQKKKERNSNFSNNNVNQNESPREVFNIYNSIKEQLDEVKISHKNVMGILELIKSSENN
ncbi:tandem ph domain containing protein [Anaeramoeba flamelloides]|uniref:Tandem ph domain containing protein n=1 Tax=Anaeramoeba flamelloides TaxID=1746091 RepID=A0ABQ8X3M9_9EUKA|nr:tandem ph domain containing protein [Anaeramoeba flamelloides]